MIERKFGWDCGGVTSVRQESRSSAGPWERRGKRS